MESKWAAQGSASLDELEIFQRAQQPEKTRPNSGTKRRPRDVTQSLEAYVAERYSESYEAADDFRDHSRPKPLRVLVRARRLDGLVRVPLRRLRIANVR